jgi:BMFP domain-containing protein YqiC
MSELEFAELVAELKLKTKARVAEQQARIAELEAAAKNNHVISTVLRHRDQRIAELDELLRRQGNIVARANTKELQGRIVELEAALDDLLAAFSGDVTVYDRCRKIMQKEGVGDE